MAELCRFSFLLIGSQSRLIQCGELLLQKGHDISGVITSAPPVQRWARENSLQLLKPGRDLVDRMRERPVDYLLSIDNAEILPSEILSLPRKCAINFHDAPLPKYAGVHATNWAIMNQESVHGVTWHVMTDEVDAGDILKQEIFPMSGKETALSLNGLCYEKSIQSFDRMIDELAEESIKPIRQCIRDRSYFSLWKRPPAACMIDWTCPAEEIHALCRALDYGYFPNPLGLPKLFLDDRVVVLKQTHILETESNLAPGTITLVTDETMHVATVTRDIALREFVSFDGQSLSPAVFLAASGLGEGDRLPEPDRQFADTLSKIYPSLCKHEDYWKSRLAGLEPIEIPYSKRQSPNDGMVQYIESRCYTPAAALSNRTISRKPGDFVMAAFLLYMGRIGGKEGYDINFSHGALQRKLSGTEAFFATHVPLRIDANPEQGFEDFYSALEQTMEAAAVRGSFARDLIIRDPDLRANLGHKFSRRLPVALERVHDGSGYPSEVDADLVVVIPDDGETCIWHYNGRALEESTIQCMQEQFGILLHDIAGEQNRAGFELSILPDRERHQMLLEWNNTETDYPRNQCVHELFEAQVKRTPHSVAVVFKQQQLSYRELNLRANQLAHFLRKQGVGPEVLVGICVERSLEMVIGLLGILKAGGAYVPLDPSYPQERLAYMLEETGTPVLLTQKQRLSGMPNQKGKRFCLDSDWETIAHLSKKPPAFQMTPDNLAYVIYTSGSTGQPKGTCVPHRAINRLVLDTNYITLTPSDRIAQASNSSFDAATFEIWGALLNGACLVGMTPDELLSPEEFAVTIREKRITTLFLTTALFNQLAAYAPHAFSSLKHLLFGGEAVDPKWVREVLRHGAPDRLVHVYGPTENTTFSTWYLVENVSEDEPTIPIGKPVSNTQCYIFDKHMQMVPVGIPGELCLSGDGLARGYYRRPDLTKEMFLPNPFSETPGVNLYKTGDLVRYLPDGNIEFLGRIDDQVKLRGFRIELAEIETVMSQHPDVDNVVVIMREDRPDDKKLVAYFIPKKQLEYDLSDLRAFLSKKLPDYMIPQHVVALEAFPITPNGKINRNALPAPDQTRPELEEVFVSPRTPTEVLLIGIWEEVLNLNQIGIYDNFFELGGHSLLATQIISRIHTIFQVEIPMRTLFETPTIEALAKKIDEAGNSQQDKPFPPIKHIPRQEYEI